jgi:hypothetical protein
VIGNYIGVDKNGTTALPNDGDGVYISLQAQYNLIGGDSLVEGNLISSNLESGVMITGTNTMSNTVSANIIGLSWDGVEDRGNGQGGVHISNGATNNTVGGDTAGEHNYLSGNHIGVLFNGEGTANNVVIGNYIGTDISGSSARPNTTGVFIEGGAHDNRVGGTAEGELNLISGNTHNGVIILGPVTHDNTVIGNHIGTDIEGTAGLGNGGSGIVISDSDHNTIGRLAAGGLNIISGNSNYGIAIQDSEGNTVAGNIIGMDEHLDGIVPNGSILFPATPTVGSISAVKARTIIPWPATRSAAMGTVTRAPGSGS